MDIFEGGGGGFSGGSNSNIQEASNNPQFLNQFQANSSEDTKFDALQYAFFGSGINVVEEVELGGLEDDEDELAAAGVEEQEYFIDGKEGEGLGSLSDVDDLAGAFTKIYRAVSGPRSMGVSGDMGSREGSSSAEWAREGFPSWSDQQMFDAETLQDPKRWSSQTYSSVPLTESKALHRTASYPEQQPQQQQVPRNQLFSSEPVLVPRSSFTSYPPPGGRSQQASPNQQGQHLNMSYLPGGQHMGISPPNLPPFPNPQLQISGLSHGAQFGGNMPHPQFNTGRNSRLLNQTGTHPPENSIILNDMLQQQSPQQNGLLPQQWMPQQHRMHQVHPSFGHLPGIQGQLYNPHGSSSPPISNKFEAMLGLGDMKDQRPRPMPTGRQMCYPLQGSDVGNPRTESWWPQFKSKYMSVDEIENILRMQLAATHSNDPYVDDYYHQACLAKKSSGARLKHHFCPTHIRELPPRGRANSEPHAYLQVDALGRVPFSSIRRPRPLLEVDPPNSSNSDSTDQKVVEKPLDQEPMLAARVTIEDGLCLLLDVEDIDLFLLFNQLPDGGVHLRRRRESLLEGLASSLQLDNPLGKSGPFRDNLVFLRIVSLPKGRKLLAKYLKLLFPGSDLVRIVSMAIFRHLRFLFAALPSDPRAAETTVNLVRVIASSVRAMDLGSLSACLAAVVCSAELPPLRPLGSSAGDGASVILKSVLERATEVLADPHSSSNSSMKTIAFWRTSFDDFFAILTKYCMNKYDSVMQSLLIQTHPDMPIVASEAARAISREMPVELLRASLPHTNEHQKKILLDFAQRSMPVTGVNSYGGGAGEHMTSESVRS